MKPWKRAKSPPFVALLYQQLNHQAYRNLRPSSAKALPFFLGKVKLAFNHPGRYTEEFSFTYSEAKRYGFAPGTFAKVIKELVAHGFIDPVERGGLRGGGKTNSKFRLSKRWEQFGRPDFNVIRWDGIAEKTQLQKRRSTTSLSGVSGQRKAV